MALTPNLLPEEFLEYVARHRGLSTRQLLILKYLFTEGLSIKQAASCLGSIHYENAVSKQLGKIYVIFGIKGGTAKGKKMILQTQLCESFFHWERQREFDKAIDSFEVNLDEVFADAEVSKIDFQDLKPEFFRMAEIVGNNDYTSQGEREEIIQLLSRVIRVCIRSSRE